jgi:RHS repeat-associated protein
MSIRMAARAVVLGALVVAGAAHAQEVTSQDEYNKRLKLYQTISPGGETPFGEQINLYTGELSFRQTDISFPGIGPEISITRSTGTSMESRGYVPLAFGNWDISLPRIETLVGPPDDWVPTRCTNLGASQLDFGWHGISLVTGDGDRQNVLKRVAQYPTKPTMTEGGQAVTFSGITSSNWQIGCYDLEPGQSSEQGFLVVSPDGRKYYLSQLVFSTASTYRWQEEINGYWDKQFRKLATMNVSKIVDRFNNSLTFIYSGADPKKLTSIVASDGRQVDITWRSDSPVINTITMRTFDGSPQRTWTYQYSGLSSTAAWLTGVVLPDGSAWQFGGIVGYVFEAPPSDNNAGNSLGDCDRRDAVGLPSFPSQTGTVTSPTGLTGTFEVRATWHGRSYVESGCTDFIRKIATPSIFGSHALVKRTISGAGIPSQSWTYTYAPAQGSVNALQKDACVLAGNCLETSWIDIVDPQGDRTRHTFSNRFGLTDGRALKVETFDGSTLLRTETFAYASPTNGSWPTRIGESMDDQPDSVKLRQETWTPMSARNISQQGLNFYWSATAFNEYAKPTTETRQTTGGPLKTDTTVYRHNIAKWIIGQVERTTSKGDTFTSPVTTSRIVYSNDFPITFYEFEKLKQNVAWNGNGTVAWVKDGADNKTTFSSYKRGIPQTIAFADGKSKTAWVNDLGQLDWVKDENTYQTCYDFDIMGRLTKITYPSTAGMVCDTSAWNPLVRSFSPKTTSDMDYGLGTTHWVERVNTDKGYTKTHYDALWRPVVVERYELGVGSTLSQAFTRYDSDGNVVYQSYPTTGISTYLTTSLGTRTTYDALGRPTRVEQDAESTFTGGIVATTMAYETGFKTRTTNARNYATVSEYLTFDQPVTDLPEKITRPDGAITLINRDLFGKPKSIVRQDAGGTLSATRSYYYTSAQELCRVNEPESNSTVMGYDAAWNLLWSAGGYAIDDGCADASWVASRRVDRTYDARNRIETLTFPDARGNTTYGYTPDGLQSTLAVNNFSGNTVTTSYEYNPRRLLTKETMDWDLITWPITYTYNKNGHLSSQGYPGNFNVTYAPNALGQATQAGSYATGVTYHPNGGIASFLYGNGITHTMTQNERQLPVRSKDAFGSSTIYLDDNYDYDANGNVAAISDGTVGNRGDRIMYYDSVDRLTRMTAQSILGGSGNIYYGYDALDNIISVSSPNRSQRYCYNAANRLEFLRAGATVLCPTGAAMVAFTYDLQGNLDYKNEVNHDFDYGNRLRSVTNGPTVSTYVYDALGRRVRDYNSASRYSLYAQSGQLAFTSDARKRENVNYVYLGGSLVATSTLPTGGTTPTIEYQHTDALGTPVVVTTAGRGIAQKSEYEPYGAVLNRAKEDGIGFTGHVEDAATGLTYMQQRYYDPQVGRFLSVDPDATDKVSAWNFNRYNYAANNPYKFKDPDGRVIDTLIDAAFTINDGGRFLGAGGAFLVGKITGNDALAKEGLEGLKEHGGALAGDAVATVVPFVSAPMVKTASNAVDLGKRFSSEKKALVEMAKADAKNGVTRADMKAYKELNDGLPDPFPSNKVRLDEGHPGRGQHAQQPHGHVGPVDYIKILDP